MLQARRVLLAAHSLNFKRSLTWNAAWTPSKAKDSDKDFVYFHAPEIDLFWHCLERGSDGQERTIDLSSERYSEKQIQLHNHRICEDWQDYVQGMNQRSDGLERLQVWLSFTEVHSGGSRFFVNQITVQIKLEKDMLDNAFVERTRQIMSSIRRRTHTSDAMAMQWMQASQGATTFLQVPASVTNLSRL